MARQPEANRDEQPINVLIIDDQVAFSDGLAYWLENDGFRVITIASVDGLPTAIKSFSPDVALVDLQLPDHDEGLSLPAQIRKLSPATKCVALTGVKKEVLAQFVPRAIHGDPENFFDGFLTKDMHSADIADAVRTVVTKGGMVAPSVFDYVHGRPDQLTDTQRRCLELMEQGKTHKEIGAALSVSSRTSKRYVKQLKELFGATKQQEVVALALKRGVRGS
jgi:DNA-binding NarL/FixJ family response regulator